MTSNKYKDFSISSTSFFMKIGGFWLASNYVEECKRKFAVGYTVFTLILSMVTEIIDLRLNWTDFSRSVYTGCNVITILLVLMKTFILILHKKELLYLVQYAETNFWHSGYDLYEKGIMKSCQRTCTILVCIFSFFAQGTVASFLIRPLIVNIGKNESERVLPFNMYINLPLSMTPYFEVLYVVQIFSAYQVGILYFCFDNFLCIINMHTASQFRILQYRFSNMFGTDDQEKCNIIPEKSTSTTDAYATFKNFVHQHQTLIAYCKELEKTFSTIILWQVSLFSLLICLDGYLVLMPDAPYSKRLPFMFHITGCMCQLLMFTYSCDSLIHESMNVASAGYESLWTILSMDKHGKFLRKDLLLVIMRSNSPCCLTACGFFVVSLETYTSILSTAVSYFTLLRNHAEDAVET